MNISICFVDFTFEYKINQPVWSLLNIQNVKNKGLDGNLNIFPKKKKAERIKSYRILSGQPNRIVHMLYNISNILRINNYKPRNDLLGFMPLLDLAKKW